MLIMRGNLYTFDSNTLQNQKKLMQSGNPYFSNEDPNEIYDIYVLFKFYNEFFFHGILQKCTIEWSKKMTLCAGTCENKGFGSCAIKLSEPLLKFRTPNQMKETILHQMIHAYLFITNPSACLTEGGHGKQFKEIMNNINSISKLRITVYHNFTDEVDSYRTHVWRCNGICKDQAPHYGYVKRSMNRKPQPADPWFKDHQRYCGGQFIKISEPQNTTKNISKNGKTLKTNIQLENKRQIFTGKGKTLSDYAKQMQKKAKSKQNKSKKNSSTEQKSFFQQNQIENNLYKSVQRKQNLKNKNPSKNSKQKKSKQEQQNTHKITNWFKSQGKTIQQYSRQIQQENMMSRMSFNR